jgi:hypothetical protein
MKLLVCRLNWRYIFTYIVINVHRSVVSAINHLLIRVKWIHWFINIWSVRVSGIRVLKISVCCRCVINSVHIGRLHCQFCRTEGIYHWSPQCHNFLLWNLEFLNFIFQFFIFLTHFKNTALLRISLIVTNKYANCWNPLILVWKCVEGRVSMCNLSGTEGGAKEKCRRPGGGREVHTAGWVNFVCIWCWVRSLNMSFYFGVCLRVFFYFDFVWFLGLFLIVVVATKKKRKLYNVRNVCEYLLIC